MYFSQILINRRRRQGARLLTDPQAMHAAVLAGIPSEEHGRVLWRHDTGEHVDTVYVVSEDAIDLTHIVEQAGWPELKPAQTRDNGPGLRRLEDGMEVNFRITVNPSKRDGKTGKSVARYGEEVRTQWVLDRADRLGLEIKSIAMVADEDTRFTRQSRQVTLARTTFVGTATVKAVQALRQVLTEGIGRGRAYGCGLLTVSPIC